MASLRLERGRFTVLVTAVWVFSFAAPGLAGDVEIEGGGWGHAIGMSQYGAFGQAKEGRSAEEIVEHYYTGASVAHMVVPLPDDHWLLTDTAPLWISVIAGVGKTDKPASLHFEAIGGPLTLCNGPGTEDCPRGTAQPGEDWSFRFVEGGCQFYNGPDPVGEPGTCNGSITMEDQPATRVKLTALSDGRNVFGRGTIRMRTPDEGDTLNVSVEVGIDDYLYGFGEVPSSWPAAALQAQAIAARSYAVHKSLYYGKESGFSSSRKKDCWCHLYATSIDQNYVAWAKESQPTYGVKWVAAVNATALEVVTHPNSSYTRSGIAATYYSSSTGGATENNNDIWGGSQYPYLKTVDDHWSQSSSNPYGDWKTYRSEAALASKLGLDEVDGIYILNYNASGSPGQLRVVGRDGGSIVTVDYSETGFKSKLGLRSHYVWRVDFGAVDLVAGNYGGGSTERVAAFVPDNGSWWVSSGDYTTSTWANYDTNDGWTFRKTGDFSGDGKADVALYRPSSGTWWVGVSNGSSFSTSQWATFAAAGPARVGDYDEDGKDDLAVFDSGVWKVLRSTGSSFTAATWATLSTSSGWSSQYAGDFNGDGKSDLGSYNDLTGRITVLKSNGTSFSISEWGGFVKKKSGWGKMVVGDFDENGKDDWAAYNPDTGRWWVLRSTGESFRIAEKWAEFEGKKSGWGPQLVGDFDGNGKMDIINHNPDNGNLWVLDSNGSSFVVSKWGSIGAGVVEDSVVADLNADGKDDWVAVRGKWRIARSDGSNFDVTSDGSFYG